MNRTFFEAGYDIVPDLHAGDANADLTGDWINMESYERAYHVLLKPAGSAGDDLSIHLQQAISASGGSAKDLNFTRLWYKKASTNSFTAVGQWTAVTLTTATADLDLVSVNSTDLELDSSGAYVMVEVMATSLDVSGGFKFVNNIIEGDDIGNALLIYTFWLLGGGSYKEALPLSALA